MTRGSRALAALAAASALFAGACSNSEGGSAAQPMQLELLEGTAHVQDASGTRRVEGTEKVSVGDRIVLSDRGIAELTLAEDVAFELSGARVHIDNRRQLVLERGKLLAIADGPVAVKSNPIAVHSTGGTFRVDRTLSTRVAVYGKQARIEAPGAALPIESYYEAVVPSGIVPRSTKPLQIDPSDRWDLRFLKEAIDVDARLGNLSRGLEAQLAGGTGPEFYQRVLPTGFQVSLLSGLALDRKTDELIGSLIAYEAAGEVADGAAMLDQVFGMWREGASWGLVAHRFEVTQSVLFAALLDSVNRAGLVDQGRGPALAAGPRTKASPSPSPASRPSPKAPSPSPKKEPSPQPSPQVSPSPNPLAPVTDLLDEVVQDLLGGLLPSPSPAPNGPSTQKPILPVLGS
jgi:hypothetical protein